MLEERDPKRTWSLERALQCCAGRAPLIEQYRAPEQHATAAVAAWKRPALDEPCDIQCARRSAPSFSIDHGGGELRLRYTPVQRRELASVEPRALRQRHAPVRRELWLRDLSLDPSTLGKLDDATSLNRYRAALTAIDAITDDTCTPCTRCSAPRSRPGTTSRRSRTSRSSESRIQRARRLRATSPATVHRPRTSSTTPRASPIFRAFVATSTKART